MKNNNFKNACHALAISFVISSSPVLAEVANTGTYKIDPAHTTVQFIVSHLGTSNLTGRFNSITGDINFQPNGRSTVEVAIKTDSVYTNHQKRDKHLRSPDFFNARQFPVIKFTSDKVGYNTSGEPMSIAGTLSMHGVTKAVILNVSPVGAGKDPWGGYRVGYDVTATIKRSEFGMNFMAGGIGDEIKIILNIEATKI